MLADGSDANTVRLVAAYVTSTVNAYNASHSGQTNLQPVQAEIRLWFNPGLDSLKFTGPGVFVLVLSMNAPLIACLAMAKESETKTILQVYVSSISAIEFVLGKILAFTIVVLAQTVPLLIALRVYFGDTFVGEPSSFFVATLLYCFCVAAFGVFVGAAIPSRAAALQAVSAGGIFFVFFFFWFVFPRDKIPLGSSLVSQPVLGQH